MLNLKDENLKTIVHNLKNDGQIETLSEYIDQEYGGGFVIGTRTVVYEEGLSGFESNVKGWIKEIQTDF